MIAESLVCNAVRFALIFDLFLKCLFFMGIVQNIPGHSFIHSLEVKYCFGSVLEVSLVVHSHLQHDKGFKCTLDYFWWEQIRTLNFMEKQVKRGSLGADRRSG